MITKTRHVVIYPNDILIRTIKGMPLLTQDEQRWLVERWLSPSQPLPGLEKRCTVCNETGRGSNNRIKLAYYEKCPNCNGIGRHLEVTEWEELC
jgi:hypothetical protein